jgi:NADH:ubiquinone oxidoreductase subunit 5 (subunit L)/multisubunit Na+/H+ antiporter MnhA subunit
MHPLFSRAPIAMLVVAIVGAATAFYSATIGLVQTDIKKVLAYSTVSQLGYMFLACGVGAYTAGIFHLMTHAFFKGLLFLCAGSVIHAMGGEQDMRKMGGLRKAIPVTFWTMFIATFAISGVPGFAGFFSKDEILEAAQSARANLPLWLLGLVAAGLTSFYMFRLIFLTFSVSSNLTSTRCTSTISAQHDDSTHYSRVSLDFRRLVRGTQLVGVQIASMLSSILCSFPTRPGRGGPGRISRRSAGEKAESSPAMELVHAITGRRLIVGLIGILLAWFYIADRICLRSSQRAWPASTRSCFPKLWMKSTRR